MKRGIALFVCLIMLASSQAQVRQDYRKKSAPIPPFTIEHPNGKEFSNSVLKAGKPVLLAIFSPQCDHCALALDTLQQFGSSLHNTSLILVAEARNKPYLKLFLAQHGFDTAAEFRHIGTDKGNLIYDIYNYGLLPQFNIYNAQHKLVKSFSGVFPMDSLKMYLH